MNIFTIISILVLIGVALVLVLYPLWQQTRFQTSFQPKRVGQTLEEYQARYQAQLGAIKDLMFDYEMGKVSSEDYEMLLAKAKLEAAKIRQQMDRLSAAPESGGIDATLDAEIEALITRLRHKPLADDGALLQEVNAEIQLLRNTQPKATATTGLICPACSNPLQPDDAFCSRCGRPVPPPEAEAKPAIDACPQCGYTIQPDDAFCAKCGTALTKNKSYEDVKL